MQWPGDKSEGPDKLLLWVDVGLRSAITAQRLDRSRRGLHYILDVTPELYQAQPRAELLEIVLARTVGLLGIIDAVGFVSLVDEGGAYVAGAVVDAARAALVHHAIENGTVQVDERATIIPMRIGATTIGAICIDRAVASESDRELLCVFANQAAAAVHGAQVRASA